MLRKKIVKRNNTNKIQYLCVICVISSFANGLSAQHKIRFDNDDIASLAYRNKKQDGFSAQLSLVLMFTTGAADRNGLRIGGGLTLSQTFGNWTISTGADAYKATKRFGLGTTFAGATFDNRHVGGTYYLNKYWQGDKQMSGMIRLCLFEDYKINFEDDILAYPFVGFKIYDRYRSAALELQYKGFMLGTNVYTTDIDGLTDASLYNSKGVYKNGHQLSSPIFVGYETNGLIARYGLNNKYGGYWGQNGWHRAFFNTADFRPGDYNSQFFQIGVNKPYTLY